MANILIIDDDQQILNMLSQILKRAGYGVVEALDGKQGLKLYRENPTDLIITDIIMPEKEGLETIMELQRDFPDVKIIAISGGGITLQRTICTWPEFSGFKEHLPNLLHGMNF
jgi:YesN/AraC family two-component response regulator